MTRSALNYCRDSNSVAAGIRFDDPSRTVQSDAADADINVLVRRYGLTGTMPTGVRIPSYGDFSGIDDYRTAIEAIVSAETEFMKIPAEIRQRFHHDPQAFLEFCSKEENLPELRKLGLANPLPDASPTPPTTAPEAS